MRVPLKQRMKMNHEAKQSFVLSDASNRSRLSVKGSKTLRKKRTVSEWALKRNLLFHKFDKKRPDANISSVLLNVRAHS